MTIDMQKETQKRTRNLGEIRVQQAGGDLCGGTGWIDVDLQGNKPTTKSYDSIDDAAGFIAEKGTPGQTYRIVRVYPPMKVVEQKKRSLEPA